VGFKFKRESACAGIYALYGVTCDVDATHERARNAVALLGDLFFSLFELG
jgi:hypothetical protein